MKGKRERQRILKEVISKNMVANQEELSQLLSSKGLIVAQATLSRDIKELKISKVHDSNGYYYHLPFSDSPDKLISEGALLTESIVSVEFSGSMVVFKTQPGHANMIASVIDRSALREVMGTIAGDDTIILVVREGFTRNQACDSLGKLFPRLDSKRLN